MIQRQRMKRAQGATYLRRVPVMVKILPQLREALEQSASEQGVTLSFYISGVLEEHVREQAKKVEG